VELFKLALQDLLHPSLPESLKRHIQFLKLSTLHPTQAMSSATQEFSDHRALAVILWNLIFQVILSGALAVMIGSVSFTAPGIGMGFGIGALLLGAIFIPLGAAIAFTFYYVISKFVLNAHGSMRRHLVGYAWLTSFNLVVFGAGSIANLIELYTFSTLFLATLGGITAWGFVIYFLRPLFVGINGAQGSRVKILQVVLTVFLAFSSIVRLTGGIFSNGFELASFTGDQALKEALYKAYRNESSFDLADEIKEESELRTLTKESVLSSRKNTNFHCEIKDAEGNSCLQFSGGSNNVQKFLAKTSCKQKQNARLATGPCPIKKQTQVCRFVNLGKGIHLDVYSYKEPGAFELMCPSDQFVAIAE